MNSRLERPMPVTLLMAVGLDVLFAAFLLTLVVLNLIGSAQSFAVNKPINGVIAIVLAVTFGFFSMFALRATLLLSRRAASGAVASYMSCVFTVPLAFIGLQSFDILVAGALIVWTVALIACLVSRSARSALERAPAATPAPSTGILQLLDHSRGDPPPPLDLRQPRKDDTLLALGGLALVAVGVGVGLTGQIMGWVCVALFIPVTAVAVVRLGLDSPKLAATPQGLTVTRWRSAKTYRWEKIELFRVLRQAERLYRVTFNMRPSYEAAREPLSITRVLTGSDVLLPSNFGMSANQLAAALNRWLEWAAGKSSS